MRIDLVITELPMGGAERCLTELAIGLQRRGEAVRVLTLGPPPQGPNAALVRRLAGDRIPFLSMQASSIWSAPLAFRRLRRSFATDRPQVVQTFLHHANVLGTWAARRAGVPACIGGIRVAQPSLTRAFLERRATARMDAVVSVSHAVERFARQHLLPASVESTVIPNGVDLTPFRTAEPVAWTDWGLPPEAQVALFVGRLAPQKGLDSLFLAAERFLRHDDRRWLVLVGEGPQRGFAEAACQQLPGGRGRVIGWQAEIPRLLAAARLLVLTSRYEGMPNAVLEAMAASRPVVTFDVEGVAELLGPEREHQRIEKRDPQAFADAVLRFFQDPAAATAQGGRNQARVAGHFSLEAMVDAYAALYRKTREQLAT